MQVNCAWDQKLLHGTAEVSSSMTAHKICQISMAVWGEWRRDDPGWCWMSRPNNSWNNVQLGLHHVLGPLSIMLHLYIHCIFLWHCFPLGYRILGEFHICAESEDGGLLRYGSSSHHYTLWKNQGLTQIICVDLVKQIAPLGSTDYLLGCAKHSSLGIWALNIVPSLTPACF